MRRHFFPWFRRADARVEVEDEIGFHLEMRERELIAAGVEPEEARRRARRMFGDVAGLRESCVEIDERRARGRRLRDALAALRQDIRYALRTLWRSPAFAVSALALLALGIGANSTLFALVDAIVLRPLPGLRDVDSLVEMSTQHVSYPTYRDLAAVGPAFAGVTAFSGRSVALGDGETTRMGRSTVVPGNFFAVLGGRAALGRVLEPGDDAAGAPPVAVLSDGGWRRLLGADPAAVGRALRVNGRTVTVVGVAAPGFTGPRMDAPDLWMPIAVWPLIAPPAFGAVQLDSRNWSWLRVVARLAPGVSPARAEQALNVTGDQLRAADPKARLQPRLELVPLARAATGVGGGPGAVAFLTVLGAVVTLVLLITCANLANLLLARAARRRREIAVRLALGAGRGRLVRQLLTEALVLALLASGLGLGLTALATELLDGAALPGGTLALHLDWRVAGFTLAVSLVTGVLFGLAPALQATRSELVSGLKSTPGGGDRSRLRGLLLSGQVAMSLVLLIGAGLFARALQRALAIDPGFRPTGVAVATVDPGLARLDGPAAAAYVDEAARRVRGLPGVESVTWSTSLPLTDDENVETLKIGGYTPAADENMDVEIAFAGADLPATLGIPLLAGRPIDGRDVAGSPEAAMVNEALARRFFGGAGAAVGKVIQVGGRTSTIVGVTRDIKAHTLREEPHPYVWLAQAQQLSKASFLSATAMLVRARVPPRTLLPSLERELRATSSAVPIFATGSLDEVVAELLLPQRLGVWLLGGFSLLAVAVAALGIFGVVAYGVTQRRREIGIRMALGADRHAVLRLVLRRNLGFVSVGIVAGLAGAAGATRIAEGFLYGIPALDAPTYAVTAAVLLAASLLAAYLPARGATRVSPTIALSEE